jgi:hypothetical protein
VAHALKVVQVSAPSWGVRSRRIAMSAVMNPDQLVMEYLAALRVAVTGLPRADELVAEVGARIAEVRTARPDDGPAEVQAFLDRLGNPYEIAATAFRPRPPVVPALPPPARRTSVRALPPLPPAAGRSNAAEAVAVVALTAGSVLLPVVAPFAGVVMASCSPRWRPGDKLWAWLLVTSPLLFLLVSLPVLVLAGSDEFAAAVMVMTAGGAVLGPMVAGGMLAGRLSRPQPRHALPEDTYGRPYHLADAYRPRSRWDGPPYPPRFQPVRPYPVRSSGRSYPKGW